MKNPFNKEQLSFIQELISKRNKSLRHEVSDHIDNSLPVKKLEGSDTGSLLVGTESGGIWVPPAAGDGYGISSDSSQTGGVKWAVDGQQVPDGRMVITSTATTASLAAGADSGDLFGNVFAITGNGVNPVLIEVSMYGPYVSAGSAGHFDLFLWDGAITSGTRIGGCQVYVAATGQSGGGRVVRGYLAAFSGSKTIRLAFRSGVSNMTMTNQASSVAPTIAIATWLPA